MKKVILSVFAVCAFMSWPISASAQSNNGQSNNGQDNGIKGVKPKVEAGLNGEFKVKPAVRQGGWSDAIEKKAAEAQRKEAEEKRNQSSGQSGNSSSSGKGDK